MYLNIPTNKTRNVKFRREEIRCMLYVIRYTFRAYQPYFESSICYYCLIYVVKINSFECKDTKPQRV